MQQKMQRRNYDSVRFFRDLMRGLNAGRTILARFTAEETGAVYPVTSFIMITLVVSIPLGLMYLSMYFTLCAAGRLTNFLIGVF